MKYRHFLGLFNEIVERQPAKTAILVEGRQAYSYRQLNRKALRIAGQLVDAGVIPGAVVGIGISKSADYIAAMLGIWYAGAVFLPLDPELPGERVQFIINQSKMRALLAKPAGIAVFGDISRASDLPVVMVDDNWSLDETEGDASRIDEKTRDAETRNTQPALEHLAGSLSADQPAYIIYTSGSTGRPKGVVVPHRGIVNFIEAQIEAFKLTSESVALFFLSTNFDASVSDIGTALLSGATLCIEPQGLLRPGPHFMPLLKERNITHMDIPPSVLKTLDPYDKPVSLETIIIGGEACAPDVVRSWASRCLVVNVYGPTEATVCTSLGACDPSAWQRPLIGQPINGVDYVILDESEEPVKVGTAGELYIGGISLALGYVNEPELSARKFVTVRGERLYRTGDQVILHDDGEIEFLGRVDRQFKLRGMLIEPEEIEAKIATHPEVLRAAVLKRPGRSMQNGFLEDKAVKSPRGESIESISTVPEPGVRTSAGGDKLVAFVSCKPGSSLDANALRKHLSKSLPLWMVPSLFEFLEELPATITGKVDLAKLRVMPLSASFRRPSDEALTPTQLTLVDVWKQVFELDSVSLDDDFYDLGGDSLNIVEAVVAAHVRGLTIGPEMIQAYSSIADLSRAIEDERNNGQIQPASEGMESGSIRENIEPEISALKSLALHSGGWASRESWEERTIASKPSKIFLTGATGFLGSRLLDELLDRTEADFYCLVRCISQSAGLERVREALKAHGKSIEAGRERRIFIVNGSLEQPRFGLDRDYWERLCNEIDMIVHCAAAVNMVKDYFELRPVNLEGTGYIGSLWLEGQPKALHYASTLSVFVATSNNTGVAFEANQLADTCTVYGGYAQTKFASEVLLRSLNDNGLPISFYRFGLLTGDSHSGRSARDDFLNMFIAGISALGCAPESDANVTVDITPIDYAAKAMAHIVLESLTYKGSFTYHIANDRSLALNDLIRYIRDSGVDIKIVTAPQFLSRLREKAGKITTAESAACLALCRSLGADESFERFRTMDLFQATDIRFDCRNTLSALEGTRISCPAPDAHLIQKYIAGVVKGSVIARDS